MPDDAPIDPNIKIYVQRECKNLIKEELAARLTLFNIGAFTAFFSAICVLGAAALKIGIDLYSQEQLTPEKVNAVIENNIFRNELFDSKLSRLIDASLARINDDIIDSESKIISIKGHLEHIDRRSEKIAEMQAELDNVTSEIKFLDKKVIDLQNYLRVIGEQYQLFTDSANRAVRDLLGGFESLIREERAGELNQIGHRAAEIIAYNIRSNSEFNQSILGALLPPGSVFFTSMNCPQQTRPVGVVDIGLRSRQARAINNLLEKSCHQPSTGMLSFCGEFDRINERTIEILQQRYERDCSHDGSQDVLACARLAESFSSTEFHVVDAIDIAINFRFQGTPEIVVACMVESEGR